MDVKIESAWFQTSIQTKIQDISMILERKRIIISIQSKHKDIQKSIKIYLFDK